MTNINNFIHLINSACRIVGFTGAGLSTESGISDYRSQGGLWQKFQPVYFDEFLQSEEKRKQYWERKYFMWSQLKKAKPNAGHKFFKWLDDRGKLHSVITQNIDGLHQKAGLPSEKVIELHGTALEIICLNCHKIFSTYMIEYKPEQKTPRCEKCHGLLKPNTISFGQSLNLETLDKAKNVIGSCDLMLIVGSTLLVQPAASYPNYAIENGIKLIIINLSETPIDKLATLVIKNKCGEFLQSIMNLNEN